MNVYKVSELLQCEGLCFQKDMNCIYDIFHDCFMKQENRPDYNGKFIFFNMNKDIKVEINGIRVNKTLSKSERFLHIVSLENNGKKYNVDPCSNDDAITYCKNECNTDNSNLGEFKLLHRSECYYRLMRIHRIPEVIQLANNKDKDIQEWSEIEKDKKNNKIYKRFIRYNHKKDDYIIILKENRKNGSIDRYEFITAFPLFKRENKKEYDKKYQKYIQKK